MAKYRNIGSVLKRKEGTGTYIKISEDVLLKKGTIVNLVNPRTQADELLAAGVVTEEVAERIREQNAKTPDFVKFNLQVKNEN